MNPPASFTGELSRRNFGLGVVNGAFYILLTAFIDIDTILPGFAWELTAGNTLLVGLLVSLINTGWFWPQLFMPSVIANHRRMIPWYWISATVRGTCLIALAVVAWSLPSLPPLVGFALIALAYLTYTTGGGLSMIPFMTIVIDSIPAHYRGRFFGARYLLGGLMAFGAGFWIRWVLSDRSGFDFPTNYAVLFTVGAGVGAISLFSFCLAEEHEHPVQRRRLPILVELRRGWRVTRRDRNYRRFLVNRALRALACGLTLPFIVPYALSDLSVPRAAVGIFMGCKLVTYSLSNLLWSRVSDRQGNKRLMVLSGWLSILPVVVVLLAVFLPATPALTVSGLAMNWRVVALGVAFALIGSANAGQEIGGLNFLLDIIPERKRTVYLGFHYLLQAPLAWVPFMGALLIGQAGRFHLGFGLAIVLVLGMMWYTYRLREMRLLASDEAATTSAWRRR
jgi:MFS family permease